MGRPGCDDVVLITGFPQMQARKLCAHILASEPRTCVALVVLERLLGRAEAALEHLSDEVRERVELYVGDAAAIDLGLSGSEYRQLARDVSRIHHIAHVSYLGVDRQTAKQVNVGAAAEAIELARAAEHLRCLVHHSTAHVSGDRHGTVLEDELERGQRFHDHVQETRYEAERLMRRAMKGLPVAVVRPTMVVGASDTGEADRFDGPYLLVLMILGIPGEMAFPLPSGGDKPLDIVPVDYVVKAAHAIGRHPDAPGHTYHLASSERLTAGDVFAAIAHAGGRRTRATFLPAQVMNALLSAPGIDRMLRTPRALVQQLVTGARYDTRKAHAILRNSGIECPPLAAYVDTMVATTVDRFGLRKRDVRAAGDEAGT